MANPEILVCMEGPKCSAKYFNDFETRVKLNGPQNQGTGNLCQDLTEKAKELGVSVKVTPSKCLDFCPVPGERSSLIGPDGKIHRAYFDDLSTLLDNIL